MTLGVRAMVIPVTQMIDIMKQGLTDSLQQTISQKASETLSELLKEHEKEKYKIFNEDEYEKICDMKEQIKDVLSFEPIPEKIRYELKNHVTNNEFIVAGGCFTSMLQNREVNDYDLFLLGYDHDTMSDIIFELNVIQNKEQGRFITVDHSEYQRNPNIIKTWLDTRTRIQYIFTKYKTRKELVDHFDFVHCCVSYDIGEDKLYISREVYDMNMKKKLKKNPTSVGMNPERVTKFENRGWTRYYEAGTL